MISEDDNTKKTDVSRSLSYRCPYCLATEKAEQQDAGSERSCSHCHEMARVPDAKLTISGKPPLGRKIRPKDGASKAPVSRVKVLPDKPVEPSHVQLSGRGATENIREGGQSFPFGKIVIGLLFLIVTAAAAIGLSRIDWSRAPATAENALPSTEVVFSEIDFAYQKLRAADMAIQAIEQDLKVTLVEFQKLAGAEVTMQAEIGVIEDAIVQREQVIQADLADARGSISNLVRYHRMDRGYVEDLFEQKIEQAESRNRSQQSITYVEMLSYIQKIPADLQDVSSELIKSIKYP